MNETIRVGGAVLLLLAGAAAAQDSDEATADSTINQRGQLDDFDAEAYTVTDGEAIYASLCSGCHMPDGGGAVGAGHYPALSGNPSLEYASYPIYVIVNGQGAMPSLDHLLDAEQVVAVTEYIQTELGNGYESDATVQLVEDSRLDPEDGDTEEHE